MKKEKKKIYKKGKHIYTVAWLPGYVVSFITKWCHVFVYIHTYVYIRMTQIYFKCWHSVAELSKWY